MSDKTVRITQELNSRKPQDQTAKADAEPAFRVSPDVSLSEKWSDHPVKLFAIRFKDIITGIKYVIGHNLEHRQQLR